MIRARIFSRMIRIQARKSELQAKSRSYAAKVGDTAGQTPESEPNHPEKVPEWGLGTSTEPPPYSLLESTLIMIFLCKKNYIIVSWTMALPPLRKLNKTWRPKAHWLVGLDFLESTPATCDFPMRDKAILDMIPWRWPFRSWQVLSRALLETGSQDPVATQVPT